jgi:hypothetical protein
MGDGTIRLELDLKSFSRTQNLQVVACFLLTGCDDCIQGIITAIRTVVEQTHAGYASLPGKRKKVIRATVAPLRLVFLG